jgi:hypothetical protein
MVMAEVLSLNAARRRRGMQVPEMTPAVEWPVRKGEIAEMFGVTVRTVDMWVSRDGMPQRGEAEGGCWWPAAGGRKYIASLVAQWLESGQRTRSSA